MQLPGMDFQLGADIDALREAVVLVGVVAVGALLRPQPRRREQLTRLPEHGQLPAGLEAIARRYEAAFGHYGRREFARAAALLETNLSGDLADPPSRVLLDRCRRFMTQPPAADWDGSFVLTSK